MLLMSMKLGKLLKRRGGRVEERRRGREDRRGDALWSRTAEVAVCRHTHMPKVCVCVTSRCVNKEYSVIPSGAAVDTLR